MTTPAIHHVRNSRPIRTAAHPTRARGRTRLRALVFRFDQLPEVRRMVKTWDEVKALLGGKGANLAEMTRLGLPVPPGFTVTSEACRAFLRTGNWPKGLWEAEVAALQELEKRTGKRFGDPADPLLVSCRSGAKFSMPGMMDTVLNIGLNAESVQGLVELTGDPRFAWDAYRRLVQMFGTVVLGVRDEPFEARAGRVPAPGGGWRTTPTWPPRTCVAITERFQAHRPRAVGPGVPRRPAGAAAARDRGGVPLVERQARPATTGTPRAFPTTSAPR